MAPIHDRVRPSGCLVSVLVLSWFPSHWVGMGNHACIAGFAQSGRRLVVGPVFGSARHRFGSHGVSLAASMAHSVYLALCSMGSVRYGAPQLVCEVWDLPCDVLAGGSLCLPRHYGAALPWRWQLGISLGELWSSLSREVWIPSWLGAGAGSRAEQPRRRELRDSTTHTDPRVREPREPRVPSPIPMPRSGLCPCVVGRLWDRDRDRNLKLKEGINSSRPINNSHRHHLGLLRAHGGLAR